MKKSTRILALMLMLTMLLSMAALATDGAVSNDKATVTPATGSTVSFSTVSGEEDKINVTYQNAVIAQGKFYLVLMISGSGQSINEDTILYIDQITAAENGKLEFSVFPSALKSGVVMVVAEGVTPEAGLAGIRAATIDVKFILGDVNSDGKINAYDAMFIAQEIVGLNPTGFVEMAADVNGDGKINAYDAMLVAQYIVGIIKEFPNA